VVTALLDDPARTGPEGADPGDPPRRRIAVRRSRVIAGAVGLVVVAAALGWLLSWHSPIPVREVVVSGAVPETAVEVEATAGISLGTPLREVDAAGALARVQQVEGIDGASLELQRPWTVIVHVQERVPFAVAAAGDVWTVLDDRGQPIRQVDKRPKRLPEVPQSDAAEPALLAVLAALDPRTQAKVAALTATPEGTIALQMRNGATVDWGAPDEHAEKARVLGALLPLQAERYSVAVPQRPAVGGDVVLPKRNQKRPAAE